MKARKRLKIQMTLLLCLALLAHPATAFAVSENETSLSQDAAVVFADEVSASENGSEGTSSDDTVPVSLSDDEVPEDAASGDETAVSEDEVCVSEDEIPVSEDAVSKAEVPSYDEEIGELNGILSNGGVYGVIIAAGGCHLFEEPSESAKVTAKLSCADTVLLWKAVYEEKELWFEVSSFEGETEHRGFLKRRDFVCVDGDFCEWENRKGAVERDAVNIMSTEGSGIFSADILESQAQESFENFPLSYRDKLSALHASRPNWVFVPQRHSVTTLDEAVAGEYADRNRNWIPKSAPDSFREGAADASGYWFYASRTAIKYYMNPINCFDEGHIFMFEQLAYNSKYHTSDGVQSILDNTFMSGKIPGDAKSRTYTEAFMEIGKNRNLSPYHLASRVRLEQGVDGTSPLISGTYPGFEGYYNYFNIKASGTTDEEVWRSGLTYAKAQGWNTRFKSLNGGAGFLGNNYIGVGQDTGYLEKWDLIDPLYTHQYMQNVMAPFTEAATTYNQYKSAGTLKNAFVFKIPVFDDAKDPDAIPPDSVTKFTPSVTLTQISKPNLFFADDEASGFARFRVTSNFDIKRIVDREKTRENAAGDPYFAVSSFENGILTLKTVDRKPSSSKETYRKIFIEVSGDAVTGDVTVNPGIEVKRAFEKPVIKAGGALFIEGFDSAVSMLNDASKNPVKLPEDTKVTCDDPGITCFVDTAKSRIILQRTATFEPGKKTFLLSSAAWAGTIKVTANVKDAPKPSVSLQKSSAVINTNVPAEKGPVDTRIIRTEGFATDIDVSVSGANAKTREALGTTVSAAYADGVLSVSAIGAGPEPGNFVLKLTPSYRGGDGQMYPLKALKFTVKVTDRELSSALGLKKSGTINTVNREYSCVKYVPAVANTGCTAVSCVSIENADAASLFDADFLEKGDIAPDRSVVTNNAGTIVISAKESVSLNSGQNYPVVLDVTMKNGVVIQKELKVRPVQKPAKIYCDLKKATMTRQTSTSRNIAIISKGGTPKNTVIKSVVLKDDNAGRFFTLEETGAVNGSARRFEGLLRLTDTSVKNGTYKVKFLVTLVDHAQNVNPVTVTTTIRVK